MTTWKNFFFAAALTTVGTMADPHLAAQLSWEGRSRNEQAIEQTLIQSGWLTPADSKTAMRIPAK